MEMAFIILKQTLVMGIYMAAGYILFKTGKITLEGSRTLANVLIWLITPCMLIRSFCVEYSTEKLIMLGQSFVLCTIAMFLSIFVASRIFRKNAIDRFAAAFSNAGFIGIPLILAAMGQEAVFYICGLLVWVNLLQWSWGVAIIKGEKMSFSPRALLTNPFIYATLISLFLFLTGLGTRLPSVVSTAISGIADLTAPIAMLILGVYLAQTKISKLFAMPRLYFLSVIRMWLIPLLTLLVFALFPFPSDIRMTVLISAAAPVGANVAVYAQMYNGDYPYACQTVAQSTVLSIAMQPLFIMLASFVLGM